MGGGLHPWGSLAPTGHGQEISWATHLLIMRKCKDAQEWVF